MEDYPSLVEGIGLENREVRKLARGFESLIFRHYYRGVEQLVARWAHNPKVVGSSPTPATNGLVVKWLSRLSVTEEIAGSSPVKTAIFGLIAQSVEQLIEAQCVGGSIPSQTTKFKKIFLCTNCFFWYN